jgi:hypothetical protein
MPRKHHSLNRRDFIKLTALTLGGTTLACGKGRQILQPTADSQTPATPSAVAVRASPSASPSASLSTPTPLGPRARIITPNDFIPEQVNYVDTLVVLVNFSDRRDQVYDLGQYWERIFGTDDPIRQLNAYYDRIFYSQLQMRPVEIGPKRYIEIELAGAPMDYSFGWLVGMETEDIAQFDADKAEKLTLEVMTKVVEQHPELDYQDKYIILVLNAFGYEYGRGAAGVLPSAGIDPVYDLFIGELAAADQGKYADPTYFRIVGDRLLGLISKSGYTFDDYFRDRGEAAANDQFLRGVAAFGKDGPLSCATHDILHGLRRRSAYANPPEGRARAVNCLYNLILQSTWMVGSDEHGKFDRSVNVSPHIGWWDPMADHLHPAVDRTFFASHPHGMSAFTRLRMGLIPERCLASPQEDEVTLKLASLSRPTLPGPAETVQTLAVKIPLLPGNPAASHIYLLLEYRSRYGDAVHPDNFTITPDFIFGDPQYDPGCPPAKPTECHYINPPTQFVSKEGVLVYLVNEKMPEISTPEYTPADWYKFVLVLLNPAGNEQRADLTQAPLAAGERIVVDGANLYPEASAPVKITISVSELTGEYAQVQFTRELT